LGRFQFALLPGFFLGPASVPRRQAGFQKGSLVWGQGQAGGFGPTRKLIEPGLAQQEAGVMISGLPLEDGSGQEAL
jgi:hypothetical protein